MGWEIGVQLKWKFTPTIDCSSEVTFSGVLKGPSSFKVKSPSFSAFRAVLLKLQCSYKSPGGFDKRQNLTGLGWGARYYRYCILASSQAMLLLWLLLAHGSGP